MPSQVLTKRRVKRRQQRLRLVSKNAKRKVRSSVRKHRKTAKKVMRGGENEKIKVYYLKNINVEKSNYNRMACLILRVEKSKDDVYLVFDMDVTADDINQIVKNALGIQQTSVLEPEIDIIKKPGYAYSYTYCDYLGKKLYLGLNPTFVKLSFTRPGITSPWKFNINSGKMIEDDKMLVIVSFDKLEQTSHTVKEANVKLPVSGGDIIKNMENNRLEHFKFSNGGNWRAEGDFSPSDVVEICKALGDLVHVSCEGYF